MQEFEISLLYHAYISLERDAKHKRGTLIEVCFIRFHNMCQTVKHLASRKNSAHLLSKRNLQFKSLKNPHCNGIGPCYINLDPRQWGL